MGLGHCVLEAEIFGAACGNGGGEGTTCPVGIFGVATHGFKAGGAAFGYKQVDLNLARAMAAFHQNRLWPKCHQRFALGLHIRLCLRS